VAVHGGGEGLVRQPWLQGQPLGDKHRRAGVAEVELNPFVPRVGVGTEAISERSPGGITPRILSRGADSGHPLGFAVDEVVEAPLALPECVFHASLNYDGKGPPLSLSGRRIGNGSAVFLGSLHGLMDVFDREVGPHDRVLMRGQGLSDAHQRSVRSSRNTGLPQIWVWGTKGETVHALVEPSQRVYVVADDLQIVNDSLRISLHPDPFLAHS